MVQDIVERREIEQGILWLGEMGKKDSCKPRIASFISTIFYLMVSHLSPQDKPPVQVQF